MQQFSPLFSWVAFFSSSLYSLCGFFVLDFRYTWVPAFMLPIKIKVIFLHQIITERLVTICSNQKKKKLSEIVENGEKQTFFFFSVSCCCRVEMKEKGHIYLSNYFNGKSIKSRRFPTFIRDFYFFFVRWLSCSVHIHWNKWATCLIKNVNMISGLCSFCTILYHQQSCVKADTFIFVSLFFLTFIPFVRLVFVLNDDPRPMTKISTLYDTFLVHEYVRRNLHPNGNQ